jgi:CheY-like chemotaxis protein
MRPTILVVDDEPDVVELIEVNLTPRGYNVTAAYDGLEAVLKAQRTKPDLIVLDVMMEGMDGLSVCEALHAQPATRNIPVIILTAATGEMARMSSFAAGAADFVSKPFSPQDLCRRIARLLEAAAKTSATGKPA